MSGDKRQSFLQYNTIAVHIQKLNLDFVLLDATILTFYLLHPVRGCLRNSLFIISQWFFSLSASYCKDWFSNSGFLSDLWLVFESIDWKHMSGVNRWSNQLQSKPLCHTIRKLQEGQRQGKGHCTPSMQLSLALTWWIGLSVEMLLLPLQETPRMLLAVS